MVDIKELLQGYGIKGIKQTEKEIMFSCPWHEDSTPSASMNINTGIYHCFGCGVKGTVIDFISKFENISYEDAKILTKKKGFTRREIDLMQEVRRILFEDKKGEEFLDEEILKKYNKQIHKSILNRVGDNKEILKKFEIGYSKEDQRTTMPIRDHFGKLVGIIGRVINGNGPKYKNIVPPQGFKKSEYLYGLHLCKNELMLILCEGEFDVINFYRWGFPYAVAIMGSSLSEKQKDLLTRYTNHVLLALDNDSTGKQATEKITETLKKIIKVSRFKYIVNKKDPGELVQEELYEGIGQAEEVL
jgi:DNA primase